MENNENVIENEQKVEDFITQVKEIKENTVSKEDYEKVLEDRKKLMQALIDGNTDGIELPDNSSDDELDKRISFELINNSLAISSDFIPCLAKFHTSSLFIFSDELNASLNFANKASVSSAVVTPK